MKIVHAVYPAPKPNASNGRDAWGRMPYASIYFHLDGKHVIEEGGFKDFPMSRPLVEAVGRGLWRGPGCPRWPT